MFEQASDELLSSEVLRLGNISNHTQIHWNNPISCHTCHKNQKFSKILTYSSKEGDRRRRWRRWWSRASARWTGIRSIDRRCLRQASIASWLFEAARIHIWINWLCVWIRLHVLELSIAMANPIELTEALSFQENFQLRQ